MAPKKSTLDPMPVHPDIILALHYLGSDPLRFHWTLFVQSRNASAGTKFHAVLDASTETGWAYDSTAFTLHTSQSVAAAAIVGKIAFGTVADLGTLLSEIPVGVVPDTDKGREKVFSCRVWIREALRVLNNKGHIDCPDVDAMEKEMWEYGAQAAADIEAETFKEAKLVKAKNSK
ncbi:hypothetical protein EYR40_003199 [Pleurotus pulmonarius]|nr:hypothetical protein EYR36_002913 [Pleurotus pulmonarius]KAF4580265.1 hypothetical protein EYR40_003199 [Pleurotus pulmonarius]